MIILLGGSSSIGKTKLAYDLMIDNKIPYFSLDSLMMGIFRSNRNCGYNPESKAELIIEKLWPIILEMVKTNIENNHSMIFEGFQISPRNFRNIESNYRSKVIPVFLAYSEKYLMANYSKIISNRSSFETRTDTEELDSLLKFNVELIHECNENGITPYIINDLYIDEMKIIKRNINLTIAST